MLCATCTQDADCGTGSACAFEQQGAATGYCALACTASSGCTNSNATCSNLFGDGSMYCYPTAGTCQPGGSTSSSSGTTGTSGTTSSSSSSGGSGAALCATCAQDADCGAGGACAMQQQGATTGYCALACTTSGGCTDSNATCSDIFGDGSQYCYPTSGTCP